MQILARCGLSWCALFALLTVPDVCVGAAPAEDTFDLLQVGARTYTNVTVTTKAKNYIFLIHQGGMVNVKVSELSPESAEKLGYDLKPKVRTNAAAAWAKETLKKIETPQVKQVEQRVLEAITPPDGSPNPLAGYLDRQTLLSALGAILVLYFFFSWCCMLICKKAGRKPGVLVWLPVLKVFPLLKAANMSGWWFLGLLVPVLNLVGCVLWCIRIAEARGKGMLTAICLILPPTSFLAFLYLAFSNPAAKQEKKPEGRVELMTLEAA